MIKCGFCTSHLQILTALSRFEVILTWDQIALFIPKDGKGMIEAHKTESIEGKIKIKEPIEYYFNVFTIGDCHVICKEKEEQ